MLFSFLMACWMDSSTLPTLNIDVINFSNEYLERPNVQVYIYDSPLICPDGNPASFFFIKPQSETPTPIAVVFHSGALDYDDLVEAEETYRATGRLRSEWASSRVWETLNLSRKTLDTAVTDLGYLPTALANAGVAQLYPTNCWGDLWHNSLDTQSNDGISEGYDRRGLDMAQFMLNLQSDVTLAEELGLQTVQDNLDNTQNIWIGLGSGGQAIIELLNQGNTAPTAIVFDSSPSDWSVYNDDDFEFEQTALERIFGATNPSDFNLDSVNVPERSAWIWSNGDSQHPIATLESGAESIESIGGWVVDTNSIGHVFVNRDWNLAEQTVQYALTGSAQVDTNSDVE